MTDAATGFKQRLKEQLRDKQLSAEYAVTEYR
jgi:hypothetical protein